MTRPLFGPEQQTLGHPATTRWLAKQDADEAADLKVIRQRELNEQTYLRAIARWMAEGTKP